MNELEQKIEKRARTDELLAVLLIFTELAHKDKMQDFFDYLTTRFEELSEP